MALFLCQAIAELILCSISAKGKSIIVYIYALLLKDSKNIEIKHEWKVSMQDSGRVLEWPRNEEHTLVP